jgi:gluconolactonase
MKLKVIAVLSCLLFCIGIQVVSGQTTIKAGASLVTEYSSSLYYEGPTWDPVAGKLLFTTPNNSPYNVYRLDSTGSASVWFANSQRINGMFVSNDGRLLACQQGNQSIVSYGIGASGPGDARTLGTDTTWYYPNDICQRPQGDIYFTCPNWESKTTGVYRIATTGAITKIISDLNKPNGIESSLDGTKLYVSDFGTLTWKVYPINSDGTIGTGSTFFTSNVSNQNGPDGMTIDNLGNLYFTGRGGFFIVSPSGAQLDYITVPETTSNITFGGTDCSVLYITCQNKVYSLQTTVRGANCGSAGTPAPTPAVTAEPGIKGDANSNGTIDIIDALLIAQYYVGLNPANFNSANADVNCSGGADIVDALLVARYYVGLVTSFPC